MERQSRIVQVAPVSMADFQKMFSEIYPNSGRTLLSGGVHLAEEMGEIGEAIHNFLGQHKGNQLDQVALEIADYISCYFSLANSARIDIAKELEKKYFNNCHACHKEPCVCTFNFVSLLKT